MAKRRRSTRSRRQRGGEGEPVTTPAQPSKSIFGTISDAFSSAAKKVSDTVSGKPTVGEKIVNSTTGTTNASAALDGAQNVANTTLPAVATPKASEALGLPAPAPGTTSTGGRRRRSRKTKRRSRRQSGKYY
jgi:hypothetical protein